MNDITLTPSVGNLTQATGNAAHPITASKGGFGELLQSFLDRVDQLQAEADRAAEDLTVGSQTDIHSAMIAVEKAGIALELALQIRNKLLNAYETLMRQQI
jgi:flagellar hook-basal body complex protein FliE